MYGRGELQTSSMVPLAASFPIKEPCTTWHIDLLILSCVSSTMPLGERQSFHAPQCPQVQEHDLQLDAISFNAAISACAKSTTWPWALQLLDGLQTSKLESDTVSFNAAISAAEDWQIAFHLLDQMDQLQVQRDIVSFNATRETNRFEVNCEALKLRSLFCFSRTKPLKVVEVFYQNPSGPSWQPPQAAISASDWHHSLLLLERMRFISMPPQLITCSTAITSCGLGGRWQDALHLFEGIQKPDLIAFNALISACEKGGAWEAALQLMRSLPQVSLRANVITYNSALSAREKSQQWQQAISILSQLPLKDGISFNACISACGRASQWQAALQLLSQAGTEGFADVVTCAASVNACSEAGLWQQAWVVWRAGISRKQRKRFEVKISNLRAVQNYCFGLFLAMNHTLLDCDMFGDEWPFQKKLAQSGSPRLLSDANHGWDQCRGPRAPAGSQVDIQFLKIGEMAYLLW